MLDGNYISWENYYGEEYLSVYNKFKETLLGTDDEEMCYKVLFDFFESAYSLMKYYIWNNGEFFFDIMRVVRKTFLLGFMEDGDSWMHLVTALYGKNKGKYSKKELVCFAKEHFKIFEDFTNKYKVLMGSNV